MPTGEIAKILEHFGVEYWRADPVRAGGPFSEVNLAATIRAEREVFVLLLHEHAAGGAAHQFCRFLFCSHNEYAPLWVAHFSWYRARLRGAFMPLLCSVREQHKVSGTPLHTLEQLFQPFKPFLAGCCIGGIGVVGVFTGSHEAVARSVVDHSVISLARRLHCRFGGRNR